MMSVSGERGEFILPIAVVTGTHSSGKTTVIDDYAKEGTRVTHPDLDLPFGLREVAQNIGQISVPVVVVPEAARTYCTLTRNPGAMREASIYPQLDVERLGESMINYATEVALLLATPIGSKKVAALLLDRSPLDALAYSEFSAPHQSHATVRIHEWLAASHLIYGNPSDHTVHNLRPQLEADAKQLDMVFMTDETAIELEDDGYRDTAESFRSRIAKSIHTLYGNIVGENNITMLRGDRQTRTASLEQGIQQMLEIALQKK